ncbi:MAG: chromate efflux transporter [Verrucomicrobiota bacterium]
MDLFKKFFEIFFTFLRLGLTSFGGPVAHLGYFHQEFVERKKWLEEKVYADLVALCQFLPGPSSSQVGFSIGLVRGGLTGGLAAWLGFTMPSAVIMILVAWGFTSMSAEMLESGFLQGLKIAAVAVIAHAIWSMAQKLCPEKKRATIALISAIIMTWFALPFIQVIVIALGASAGALFLKKDAPLKEDANDQLKIPISSTLSSICLLGFFAFLIGLPILASAIHYPAIDLLDSFYRTGSLVFGGGHVVLPLLQSEVVDPGWMTKDQFLAGYGAAQALPGPLFTISAYVGALANHGPGSWLGGLLCLTAVFLPSGLLVLGILPYWEKLRKLPTAQTLLMGANAAVVGLLISAFYIPVWSESILGPKHAAIAFASYLLLSVWKIPSWIIVIIAALLGYLLL